jgi:GT2 family glycosyltransferase
MDRPKVDIAIATWCRPKGLHRLLGAFQRLRFPDGAPDLRVVVVDNDPEGSAAAVCEQARGWLDLPLLYRIEKRRGIPQARNAAASVALERAEFLAFIDDDEVPSPLWLAELLRVQAETGADAVAGPCEPVFEEPVPRWIERGGFFARPRHATGTRLDQALTGNVLVRTRSLASLGALFDERMALSGGEDTEFFQRFAARGHAIVWADRAVVFEWVPRSRANARWILERAFRVGTSSAFVDRRCRERPVSPARLLAHGGWCLAKGATLLAVGALRGRAGAMRALRLAAFGAGRLGGLAGLRREEYRVVHGS